MKKRALRITSYIQSYQNTHLNWMRIQSLEWTGKAYQHEGRLAKRPNKVDNRNNKQPNRHRTEANTRTYRLLKAAS